jgi:putative colanic acid biosynthesis acetyltransferase WcaF
MNLAQFSSGNFDRGRSAWVESCWLVARTLAFATLNPFNGARVGALRLFGARVGAGAVIKPGVKVKFPWRLSVGDHAWIGEDTWIDNLAQVDIGEHACISQGVYLCTGNHDWASERFETQALPIHVGKGAWVAARAVVGPGVKIGDRAVVALGTVVTRDIAPGTLCVRADPSSRPLGR